MKYGEEKIPPQTHGLYRVKILRDVMKKQKIYYDMGNIMSLVQMGYTKVGYVPDAGYYHFHAESLKHLLSKRVRNIQRSYLRYNERASTKKRVYKWVDFSKPEDISKLLVLTISANLFVPIFILSLFKMIKYKTWLYILDAPITLLLVDTIVITFLKEEKGRAFLKKNILSFFQR